MWTCLCHKGQFGFTHWIFPLSPINIHTVKTWALQCLCGMPLCTILDQCFYKRPLRFLGGPIVPQEIGALYYHLYDYIAVCAGLQVSMDVNQYPERGQYSMLGCMTLASHHTVICMFSLWMCVHVQQAAPHFTHHALLMCHLQGIFLPYL